MLYIICNGIGNLVISLVGNILTFDISTGKNMAELLEIRFIFLSF